MSSDSAAALAQASDTPRMALAPSRLLFGVPSSAIMSLVDLHLIFDGVIGQRLEDFAVHGGDGLLHALAEIAALVAVAQLDRLMRAGGRARRHRRAADRTVFENDIDLDRGVAAAVQDFAADDVNNGGHVFVPRSEMWLELAGSYTGRKQM